MSARLYLAMCASLAATALGGDGACCWFGDDMARAAGGDTCASPGGSCPMVAGCDTEAACTDIIGLPLNLTSPLCGWGTQKSGTWCPTATPTPIEPGSCDGIPFLEVNYTADGKPHALVLPTPVVDACGEYKTGCRDGNHNPISKCECHPSCRICGWDDHPTNPTDCAVCADGSTPIPDFGDGTGHCPGSKGICTNGHNHSASPSFASSYTVSGLLGPSMPDRSDTPVDPVREGLFVAMPGKSCGGAPVYQVDGIAAGSGTVLYRCDREPWCTGSSYGKGQGWCTGPSARADDCCGGCCPNGDHYLQNFDESCFHSTPDRCDPNQWNDCAKYDAHTRSCPHPPNVKISPSKLSYRMQAKGSQLLIGAGEDGSGSSSWATTELEELDINGSGSDWSTSLQLTLGMCYPRIGAAARFQQFTLVEGHVRQRIFNGSSSVRPYSGRVPTAAEVSAAVQPVLDQVAERFNASFSFGWADGSANDTAAGVLAGPMLRSGNGTINPRNLIPVGSATKPWTAVAVLQYIENSTISMDTPAFSLLDKVLVPQCGYTMLELFNQNETIHYVTVGHLLAMRSGIRDYEGRLIKAWRYMFGRDDDLQPCDLLNIVDKRLLCSKPPCTATYSSIGFVLLGFIAQSLRNQSRWTDWNQLDVIPESRRYLYQEIVFAQLGTCESNPNIAHQITLATGPLLRKRINGKGLIFDLIHYSCLNGWSMGNIAASGKNLAMFMRDVFAPATAAWQPIVRPETAMAMQNWSLMGNGYGKYGLGLMEEPQYENWARFPWEQTQLYMVGHAGQDWGSGATLNSYNPHFNFGIAIVQGSTIGPNLTLPNSEVRKFLTVAKCRALDAVVRLYGHRGLDCASIDPPSPPVSDTNPALGDEVVWSNSPMPICDLCDWGIKCSSCVGQGGLNSSDDSEFCSSCYHRHPWSDDLQREVMAPGGGLPCLNACEKAGCPINASAPPAPPPTPANLPCSCVGWMPTQNCDPHGPPAKRGTEPCRTVVPFNRTSGYCLCQNNVHVYSHGCNGLAPPSSGLPANTCPTWKATFMTCEDICRDKTWNPNCGLPPPPPPPLPPPPPPPVDWKWDECGTIEHFEDVYGTAALSLRVCGDCKTSAIIKSGDPKFHYPPSHLATSKLALGVVRGAQAQSACGAPLCATLIFGQTEAACVEIRDHSPWVAVFLGAANGSCTTMRSSSPNFKASVTVTVPPWSWSMPSCTSQPESAPEPEPVPVPVPSSGSKEMREPMSTTKSDVIPAPGAGITDGPGLVGLVLMIISFVLGLAGLRTQQQSPLRQPVRSSEQPALEPLVLHEETPMQQPSPLCCCCGIVCNCDCLSPSNPRREKMGLILFLMLVGCGIVGLSLAINAATQSPQPRCNDDHSMPSAYSVCNIRSAHGFGMFQPWQLEGVYTKTQHMCSGIPIYQNGGTDGPVMYRSNTLAPGCSEDAWVIGPPARINDCCSGCCNKFGGGDHYLGVAITGCKCSMPGVAECGSNWIGQWGGHWSTNNSWGDIDVTVVPHTQPPPPTPTPTTGWLDITYPDVNGPTQCCDHHCYCAPTNDPASNPPPSASDPLQCMWDAKTRSIVFRGTAQCRSGNASCFSDAGMVVGTLPEQCRPPTAVTVPAAHPVGDTGAAKCWTRASIDHHGHFTWGACFYANANVTTDGTMTLINSGSWAFSAEDMVIRLPL